MSRSRVRRRLDAGPVAVHPLDQLAQEEQVFDAARRLVGPRRRIERRPQPRRHQPVAAPRQRRFEPGLLLEQHLLDALLVVEPRAGQHVGDDRQQLGALSGTALPRTKNQAAMVLVSRITLIERDAPTPPVERPMRCVSDTKSSLAVPGLEQRPRKDRQIRHQLRRNAAQIEPQIEIDHAVGRQACAYRAALRRCCRARSG